MPNPIELLSPIAPVRVEQLVRAPRLTKAKGTTIVLLDNTKQNTNIFMERVARDLVARFGVEHVQCVRKLDSAKPATDLGDLVRGADAVVNGIGD